MTLGFPRPARRRRSPLVLAVVRATDATRGPVRHFASVIAVVVRSGPSSDSVCPLPSVYLDFSSSSWKRQRTRIVRLAEMRTDDGG